MHYGDPIIRKSVPLALGLISTSNPQLPLLDTLSKYSHDNDLQVALNAIFAMGLVGAGTNNARLAQMLRQLAGYYYKEPDCLFTVRIAQGLVHMGKGTIGLNPFFCDRTIMSRPAVAGLLATITAFTDAKACKRYLLHLDDTKLKFECAIVVLDRHHWMLYYLASAMYPRFLITLNEDLENLPVTVRVGQVSPSAFLDRVVLMSSMRPLTWSDKPANLARSPVSRHIKRQCAWEQRSEGSWRQKSISHMHMSLKGLSSCERTLGTRKKMRCNYRLGSYVLQRGNIFTLIQFESVIRFLLSCLLFLSCLFPPSRLFQAFAA